jgi:hypothetical protein
MAGRPASSLPRNERGVGGVAAAWTHPNSWSVQQLAFLPHLRDLAIAAGIIPDCVVGIHAFWRERRARPGAGGGRRPAGGTTRPRRKG